MCNYMVNGNADTADYSGENHITSSEKGMQIRLAFMVVQR